MTGADEFNLARAAHAALLGNSSPATWDDRLRAAIDKALVHSQYREGRFVLFFLLALSLLSLAADMMLAAEYLSRIAAIRLGCVVPLCIVGLALPLRQACLQKILIAVVMTGFAFSMALASLFAPPPSDILLAFGVVILLALTLPILPFRGGALIAFMAAYLVATGSFLLVYQDDILRSEAFIPIVIITAGAAAVIAYRVHWLERRNLLLTLEAGSRAATLEGNNARLTELSMEDPLTGLANRRRAEQVFAEYYATPAAAGQAATALFMLDIDHFKAFNDRWGHQAGDACLRAVAEVMRHAASRHGGLAARFGGEEFVFLVRADDVSTAQAIAEDLRVAIERIEIDHDNDTCTASCSASIGIALHEGPDAPRLQTMLALADTALYRAKAEGRNRSVVAA